MWNKICRIGVVGKPSSGKTSLILRYTNEKFRPEDVYEPQNNNETFFKCDRDIQGDVTRIELYENRTQDVDALIITVDSTALNKESVKELDNYISELKTKISKDVGVFVVLTKFDKFCPDFMGEMETYLKNNSIRFTYVSIHNGKVIDDLIKCINIWCSIDEAIRRTQKLQNRNNAILTSYNARSTSLEDNTFEDKIFEDSSDENSENCLLSYASMLLLGGFIAALGITAVAIAFTVLLTTPVGVGLVASVGVAAVLGGIGLFAYGVYQGYKDHTQPNSVNLKN